MPAISRALAGEYLMETCQMRTTLKLALLVAVGTPWLAAPALAKVSQRYAPQAFQNGPIWDNDSVVESGVYLGRDPDPNIRFELRRDDGAYNGND
jgi:hypothetical protein